MSVLFVLSLCAP